ncbi:MAG TPA: hypothetical protein GXX34_01410 [Clostridia bacterium]|nr:hypothetical protein [Clostridia bacterium]
MSAVTGLPALTPSHSVSPGEHPLACRQKLVLETESTGNQASRLLCPYPEISLNLPRECIMPAHDARWA